MNKWCNLYNNFNYINDKYEYVFLKVMGQSKSKN